MNPTEKDGPRRTVEDVFTPWELAGESRRDCKPHRVRLLRVLAYVSVLVAGASTFLICPAVLGLLLGLATWRMACRDLHLISRGEMDTTGFHGTEKARADARGAVLLSLAVLLICSLLTATAATFFYLAMRRSSFTEP